MTRHALRSLVKSGHVGALALLGYAADVPVDVAIEIETPRACLGDALRFRVRVGADQELPVLVDYRLVLHRPKGKPGEKVFKLKTGRVKPGEAFVIDKSHKLKGNATTFRLYPGPHKVIVQVNGVDRAEAAFELV